MSSLIRLEFLPETIIQKILEFFQTQKNIKFNYDSKHEINQMIINKRKNLINGKGINTDIKTLLHFSEVCKKFNNIIKKTNVGKLLFTVHYNSKELKLSHKLEHISYCEKQDCTNICHYVNKDIMHTDIIKKIALKEYNKKKKKLQQTDVNNLVEKFRPYLTNKQIEAHYPKTQLDGPFFKDVS